jgi:copper(I)-binding protein
MNRPRVSRRLALGACLALGLSATALGAQAAPAGVKLSDPWIRYIIPDRPAAGYFTLTNDSAADHVLTGATSPACGEVMLHQTVHENGVEKMQMVMSVDLPPHGSVKFEPGGYHLMCMSPSSDIKVGAKVSVTLLFKDEGDLTADFPVYGATGK